MNSDVAMFPKSRIPLMPLPGSCQPTEEDNVTDLMDIRDNGRWRYTASGRGAIYHAIEIIGLTAGDRILVPSYHCASMLSALVERGLEPVFYRILPTLEPDLDDLSLKIDSCQALILVHYFGFPQKTDGLLAQMCRKNNIQVIEDCAHSFFFGDGGWSHIGKLGHVLIGSTRKFFPGEDGGVLVSTGSDLSLHVSRRSVLQELKSLYMLYSRANVFGQGGYIGAIIKAIAKLKSAYPNKSVSNRQIKGQAPGSVVRDKPTDWISSKDWKWGISLISRYQIHFSDNDCISSRRRANFKYFLNETKDLRARQLYSDLPDQVIPYVFPMLLDDPERDFPKLKMAELPILRWEELAVTDCEVSEEYRKRLIQIPCHHSITPEGLNWIACKLKEILA
ncbi:MAG: DegT/DnrJ/EryC1/StrS family aminotransferase [Sedimenticola sp.]